MHEDNMMFKCKTLSVTWCLFLSFVLNYYVPLGSLVRPKSPEADKIVHRPVGAREQDQGRENLRDCRSGQANTQ